MNQLLEYLMSRPPPTGPAKPVPYLNTGAKCIEWYWNTEERAYEESVHVDDVWIGCVMRSMKTNEAVGVKIFLEAIK